MQYTNIPHLQRGDGSGIGDGGGNRDGGHQNVRFGCGMRENGRGAGAVP